MAHAENKKKMKDLLKTILGLAIFFCLAGVAGHFDRLDEEVCEMKNDGSYWVLSEKYPNISDAELVALHDSIQDAGNALE